MSTSLVGKRRVRTTNTNSVKRLIDKVFEGIEDFNSEDNTIDILTSLRDTLIEKFTKVQHLNEEIIYLIEDETELQEEENLATDFVIFYRTKLAEINKFINKQLNTKPDDVISNSNKSNSMVKLPPLKLHSFDGRAEHWQTFYENFQCAVDNNEDLSSIQKLTYLRNLLEGQALSTITGLALTHDNYKVAINLLKERFDNKQLLISSHMQTLLSLEKVSNLRNISSLRQIYDNLEIQIRSLENLSIDSQQYGPLLIPVLMQKIPEELSLIISRKFNDVDCWNIKTVLNVLKTEIQAREKSNFNREENPFTAETLYSSGNLGVHNKPMNNLDNNLLCIFCEKDHKPQNCKTVTNLSARKHILKRKRRCFKCLKLGHIAKNCATKMKCFSCSNFHHASMCNEKSLPQKNDCQEEGKSSLVAGTLTKYAHSVLLQTAQVTAISNDKLSYPTRILFDSCSQLSYISPALRAKLNLQTIDVKEIIINSFGNKSEKAVLERVRFSVKGLNDFSISISCFVKDICAPINGQKIDFAVSNYNHLKGLKLADCITGDCSVDIDILVGADFYWDFFDNTTVRGKSGPVALKFKLGGYVLSGFVCDEGDNSCSVNTTHVLKVQAEFVDEDVVLKDSLKDLWYCGESCKENNLILRDFQNSTFFDETSGRYVVHLPFHENHPMLSDNYSLCVNRLRSLTKKLSKDEDLFNSYNNIIKDQLSHGIIEKVLNHDLDIGDVHYLPHRPVRRDKKVTTKVRMVFDASSKSFGPSLNDCLHAGPSLTTSLFGCLLRFRSKKIAFLADIEKAFLQIGLSETCRDYVRFLWYDDIENLHFNMLSNAKLATFRLCRVLFGVTSSPFLLNGTLKLHVEKYLNSYPSNVLKLLQSLHVDDLNSCTDEVNDGINFYRWCKSILKEGGFNLRKFESNSKVLENVFCESDFIPKPETQAFVASKSIKWRFNVAAAPWWGGIFERLIRSTKRCLKKVLTNSRLTYEELMTVIQEIECVINNRPLTFLYEEVGDEVLTPNHLVFGRKLNLEAIAEDSRNREEVEVVKQHKHINMVLSHFRTRWKEEYLKDLREHHKVSKGNGSVKIKRGDVVLIDDAPKSRILWKVGIIDEVNLSSDKEIRKATVRYKQNDVYKSINRPVNKLYPIECGDVNINVKFVEESDIPLFVVNLLTGGSVVF